MNLSDLDRVEKLKESIKENKSRIERFEKDKGDVTVSVCGTYITLGMNAPLNRKLKAVAIGVLTNRILSARAELRDLGVDPDR